MSEFEKTKEINEAAEATAVKKEIMVNADQTAIITNLEDDEEVDDYYTVIVGSGIFSGPRLSDGEVVVNKFLDEIAKFNAAQGAEIVRVCHPKNHIVV
jgi:hypothetical protein